jgi:hypothetical protein
MRMRRKLKFHDMMEKLLQYFVYKLAIEYITVQRVSVTVWA